MTADPQDGRSDRPGERGQAGDRSADRAGLGRRRARARSRETVSLGHARSVAAPEERAARGGHGADRAGAARADAAQPAGPPAQPRRRTSTRRPFRPTVDVDAARQPRGARAASRPTTSSPTSISPGLGAGAVLADRARRLVARRRRHAHRTRRPCRCESPVANTEAVRRSRGCSAPTACAAPPAAIRSIAPTVRRLGAALVRALPHGDEAPPHLLVGRDTRESGDWIEAELAHGASGEGADRDERRRRADAGGRLPDAHRRLRRRRRDLGVAQSVRGQRHQGVLGQGREVHRARRARGRSDRRRPVVDARRRRRRRRCRGADLVGAYLDHLRAVFPEAPTLERVQARRSTARTARRRRSRRRCSKPRASTPIVIGNQPDGRNINLDCGSTHPELLARDRRRARLPAGRRVRRRRRPRDLRRSSRARSSTATRCC